MSVNTEEYIGQTEYERRQEFNALVSWLHSFRYKNTIGVLDGLTQGMRGGSVRIIDIGCAHAKLFGILSEKFLIDYIGIELREDYTK